MRKLKQTVIEDLGRLASTLKKGEVSEDTLDRILGELGALPAHAAVWAERQIPSAGSFYGEVQRPSRLLGFIDREPQQQKPLREHPKLALLWMFHRNGYIREMALRALQDAPPNAFFLAALFSRLNDWAIPVQKEAERCIRRLLPRVDAHVAVDASSFLLGRWADWKRWSAEGLRLLDALMQRPDVVAAFVEKFKSIATGPLASQMRSLLRNDAMDTHIYWLALNSPNPAIRLVCFKTLANGYAEIATGFETQWIDKVYGHGKSVRTFQRRPIAQNYNINEIIVRGLNDRSTAIRRAAADAIITRFRNFPDLELHIAALLADKSAAVRERGDFLNRQMMKEKTPAQAPGFESF